jgi:hypothetical protein
MNFELSAENVPQKMTKVRLNRLLDEMGLSYSLQGEGSDFNIIINLPPEHVTEKEKIVQASVLNDSHHTVFDEQSIWPIFRAIKHSTNLDCKMLDPTDKDKYIISVFKK